MTDSVTKNIGLRWSEHRPPNSEIPYDHVIAQTPFGRVLITWKGWKNHDTATIDEFPGAGFLPSCPGLDGAKITAEREWIRRVSECLTPPTEPTNGQ